MSENQNEQKRSSVIGEGTPITIGFAILIIVGVMRVESTSFKANANEQEIKTLKEDFKAVSTELKKHGESLARIEGALGTNNQSEVAKTAQ